MEAIKICLDYPLLLFRCKETTVRTISRGHRQNNPFGIAAHGASAHIMPPSVAEGFSTESRMRTLAALPRMHARISGVSFSWSCLHACRALSALLSWH